LSNITQNPKTRPVAICKAVQNPKLTQMMKADASRSREEG